MVFVRSVTVVVLAALLQCAHNFQLTIPGLFGGTYTIETTPPSEDINANIAFGDNAITKKIEFGELGGIQTRLVSPLIPDISKTFAEVQTNLRKVAEDVSNWAKDPFGMMRNNIDKAIKDITSFSLPNANDAASWNNVFTQIMHDIDTGRLNILGLLNTAGGLLNDALAEGAITWESATSVVSAIIRSALQQRENPIAVLIDLLENSVSSNMLQQTQAIRLIARAIQAGLHQTLEGTNTALDSFLEAAGEADIVPEETAAVLRNLINPGAVTKMEYQGSSDVLPNLETFELVEEREALEMSPYTVPATPPDAHLGFEIIR